MGLKVTLPEDEPREKLNKEVQHLREVLNSKCTFFPANNSNQCGVKAVQRCRIVQKIPPDSWSKHSNVSYAFFCEKHLQPLQHVEDIKDYDWYNDEIIPFSEFEDQLHNLESKLEVEVIEELPLLNNNTLKKIE